MHVGEGWVGKKICSGGMVRHGGGECGGGEGVFCVRFSKRPGRLTDNVFLKWGGGGGFPLSNL